ASILTGKSLLAFETEGRVTDVAVSRNGLAVLWTIAQAGRRKAFVTRLMTNYSGLMNTEPCPFPLGGEVAAFDAVYRGNVLQAVAFAAQGNGAWLVKCWHITGFKESANPATLGQFSATPRFIEIGDAHTVVVAAGVEAKALAVPQRSR
ncbi:MAG: hypothetical protein HY519_01190, partial [Candidatus Aenigmarchaeota archaeon]|nr:hypothetical protein [Candidatus Aenigmarchaeota archaeon]